MSGARAAIFGRLGVSAALGAMMVALAVGTPASAALPDRAGFDHDFLIDAWETDQGLPEGSTRQMVQTADGYLWFGTMGGLVRFDGMEFAVFDRANTPGLPSDGIVNLHLDATGRLWVSTLAGLVVSAPGRWTEFQTEARWTGNFVRTFAEHAGVLCLTSFDGKIFRATGRDFAELPKPPGNPEQTYFGHVAKDGRVGVVQSGFCGYWDGQSWRESPIMAEVIRGFRGAGRGFDGSLLTYSGTELLRIEGDRIVARERLAQPVPPSWQVMEDSFGRVWMATWGAGLFCRMPSGEIRKITTANGLLSDSLRFAFEDREHNLWVGGGNGGGLVRLKSRSVVTYGLESGLTERLVKAVAEEPTGQILLGTYGKGLMSLADGRVTPVDYRGVSSAELYVQCLLRDRDGRRWLGTFGAGLQVIADGERRPISEGASGGRNINALFQDSRGTIWIGGSESVSRHENGEFELQRLVDGRTLPHCVGFAEHPRDRTIWAANAEGVFRYGDGVWREILDTAGRSVRDNQCVRGDADGTLWFGGTGGVRRYRDGRWSTIGPAQGLPVRSVASMVEDDFGFFWLGTNRGLVRAARVEMERTADGTQAVLTPQIFGTSDGLATLEASGGFSSTALKDRGGRLWFATPRGVAMVEPAKLRLNQVPPPIVLGRVSYVDRQEQKHVLYAPVPQPLILPPGSRRLEMQFAVLSYTAPDKVVLQPRFERDGLLISADLQAGRSLQSDLLAPGSYRVVMTAANNDGVWNREGATVAFSVSPFFWETRWWRAGILCVALSVVGGVTWRVQQNRLRHEREKVARERALAREHALLASILEGTSDFVAFAVPDGKMSYLNPAGRRMAGLGDREEIAELRMENFFPEAGAEIFRTTALPHAARHGTWSGDAVLLRTDGRTVPVSQVLVVHRNAAGEVLFQSTILRDITETKRAEHAIRRLNASLEERVELRTGELAARVAEVERLNAELEAFSYSVSHDLRAPLRNITGFLELLSARMQGRLDAESSRFVTTVVREAVRMGQLIDDLLAFSRVGRAELTSRRIPLGELVAEVQEELRPAHADRAIEWNVGELPAVRGDRALVRQILVNLLGNAVKFTRGRTPAVIEIGAATAVGPSGADEVTVYVKDNGAGFNSKYQEKLFGVFQRLHNQRDFEGTGIGLANVKRIVVRHGGRVWAEGSVDKGAVFYFTLPAVGGLKS